MLNERVHKRDGTFLKEERHQKILEMLSERKFLSVNYICEMLNVSEMTARRDLNYLHEQGVLVRTRGGAVAREEQDAEPSFKQRSAINAGEKKIVARTAASLICKGDVIGLGVGSTIMNLARQLRVGQAITVVTNWIPNALEVAKKQIPVYLLGGMVRPGEYSVTGDSVASSIADFQIDKYFFSTSGIDLTKGLVDYDGGEAQAVKAFLAQATQSFLLVDSSKFGRTAPTTIGPISLVDVVIVDSGLREEHRRFLEGAGIQIVIAD
jgi:DeoR/GlpR family transcriptional regulator of sugar metabolism